VGRYAYCARSWWLGVVKGLPSDRARLAAGTQAHAAHGRRVWLAAWQAGAGLALVALSLLLLLVWLVVR
jgi:hypothetical protein